MAQRIAIVDYGSGNLRSVEKALERAAREAGVAARIAVTDEPDDIAVADRLVLPGVGAFAACATGLAARSGVLEALERGVLIERRPFLGICVGMQLLADRGHEFGVHEGLGWIAGDVAEIGANHGRVRSPHMGWNTVAVDEPHALFAELDGAAFYFAHSYCFRAENEAHVLASAIHGRRFAAAIARDNIAGVQFHPEKSQTAGLALLRNFLFWNPV